MEHRAGFEPAALGICSPLHWATLPPVRCLAPVHGFEPRLVVLETIVLPLTLHRNRWELSSRKIESPSVLRVITVNSVCHFALHLEVKEGRYCSLFIWQARKDSNLRNDGVKVRCVKPLHHTPIKMFGPPTRTRTWISQLSVATEYKPAVLPLNYRRKNWWKR